MKIKIESYSLLKLFIKNYSFFIGNIYNDEEFYLFSNILIHVKKISDVDFLKCNNYVDDYYLEFLTRLKIFSKENKDKIANIYKKTSKDD